MADREKLTNIVCCAIQNECVGHCNHKPCTTVEIVVDDLIANGVTMQEDCEACAEKAQKCIEGLQEQIAEMPKKQEWISVEDRLPENETIVLCWRGRRWCEPEICTYGDLKGEKCFYYIDDCGFPMKCLRPSITHWMPLPEPPKEE